MEPKRMISKSFLIFKNEQKNKIYFADGFFSGRSLSGPFSDLVRPHSRKNYKMGYRWNNAACSRTAVPSSLNI